MKSRAEFPGAHLNLLFAIVLQYAREHDKLLQSLCHSEKRINKVAKEEPSERKVNKQNGRVCAFRFLSDKKRKKTKKEDLSCLTGKIYREDRVTGLEGQERMRWWLEDFGRREAVQECGLDR